MPLLNGLSEDELRNHDRAFGWTLILFSYVIAVAMCVDNAGWDDPVFNVIRKVPYTPYSWAAALAAATTVYAIGERVSEARKWRGKVLITGATLCALWWFAIALAMSRMVYIMPTRITDLWPLMTFMATVLYFSRVIIYANTFTGQRWNTNPYQLWGTLMLLLASLSEVIIGIAPNSILVEVERPVALQLALVNLFGATVVMFGLHLRNRETGLNLELYGAISLVVTIMWYCFTVLSGQVLAGTTIGFALTEGFTLGTFHRAAQILVLKYSRWSGKPRLERRMKQALTFEPPRHVK